MKKNILLGLLLFVIFKTHAQIDMNDSTAQVVGYWDNNEKQTYTVSHEKYKVKDNDTTSREFFRYVVDITVIDSTEDSYTIKWVYRDMEFNSDNEFLKKLSSVAENTPVTIKTDELGVFLEVVNWEEIRDSIYKILDKLQVEFNGLPNIDQMLGQIKNMYSTKESIESGTINEIQQFYLFHGGKYKLGEKINSSILLANLYGGDPFDTDVEIWLDELNPDDNNFILRMQQSVNSEQLTKTTFDYLTKVSETMKVPGPKWDDFSPLQNNTWTASRIHTSGWIIYSVETKEVSSEGTINVDETIIEIQ